MSNIFNNIKVLTDLEVKNTATMDSGLIVSGAYSGSTGLRVKEDAIIDGQLTVGGRVINQGYAQIGALAVEGVTDLNGNLYVTGSQYLTGDLDVSGRLYVDGTSSLDGILTGALNINIAGNIVASGNISGSTGQYGNLTAGTLSVNSLYLPGQFGVSGSAQLGQNASSIISISGQVSASAGIEVTTGGFNAANGTGYKLKGTEALKESSGVIVLQSGSLNKVQLGNLGYGGAFLGHEGVKLNSKDDTIVISPRTLLKLSEAGAIQLDITGSYSKLYSTAGDVLLSGSTGIYAESNLIAEKQLKLSGSTDFTNISVSRDGEGLYDVDQAIHALDAKINTSDTNYAKMRFACSGSLTPNVTTTVSLVSAGADATFFSTAQKDYLVADVMIRISSNEAWTNDLVSLQIYNDGGALKVDLDAPAAEAGWEYRMIIVNENGQMFI